MYAIDNLKINASWKISVQHHVILDSDPRDLTTPLTWKSIDVPTAINQEASLSHSLKKIGQVRSFMYTPTAIITSVNPYDKAPGTIEITWKAPRLIFRNSALANTFITKLNDELAKIRSSRIIASELTLRDSLVVWTEGAINSAINSVPGYNDAYIAHGDVLFDDNFTIKMITKGDYDLTCITQDIDDLVVLPSPK